MKNCRSDIDQGQSWRRICLKDFEPPLEPEYQAQRRVYEVP